MRQMQWFNQPEKWEIADQTLTMFVTGKTDYWRTTHYGFSVDDGPFFYREQGGEFEMTVKISGQYVSRYDQMGLMLRQNQQSWIKTGVEYIEDKVNVSTVVTREQSDWSMMCIDQDPSHLWMKMIRRLDAVEVFYSLDDQHYQMIRLAYFPPAQPVKAGMYAASPDGAGFEARFEEFQLKHLPDLGRLNWLNKNK
ncbi:MAG: DUF1349 domain-containing protein [Candidatus Cyclobacteriaceae bacterium M3_2C_046]